MTSEYKVAVVESLLFVSGEPIALGRLAKILNISEDEILALVEILTEKYSADAQCGLQIIIKDGHVELATKPENASFVEALTKSALQENLSKTALEVLSIIAYRAPITRAEIESIRGVNCSFTLRNLLLRDLIEREGNPTDARGYVYLPTFRFLESLGLQRISELPDYVTLSQDERLKILLTEDSSEKVNEHSSPLNLLP